MEIIFNAVIGKYKRFIWRVLVLIWYNLELIIKQNKPISHNLWACFITEKFEKLIYYNQKIRKPLEF